MAAIRPSQDRSQPAPIRPGAVLRPAAGDEREARRAVVVSPAAGRPGPAEPATRRGRRAAGLARLILVPMAIAGLVALAALMVGVLVMDDPAADRAIPGLRPLTDAAGGPAAGTEGDQAADGNAAAEPDGGWPGADDAAPSADEVSRERLFDAPTDPADPANTSQLPGTNGVDGAYPAPPVTEEPVVEVAEAVTRSVVRIEIDSDLGLPGVGSGIVWDAENGYIVTNQHVVEGVDEVMVRFFDGRQAAGEVVGGSVGHDVAVVRVDPDGAEMVAATFAPTSSVRVGQLAVAIGSPFGLTGTVTAGIVSAVRIHGGGGSDPDFPVPVEMIQTDASINRGNSGGALADWQGRVIGMNTFIQTTSGGSIGLGFAVPSDTVELIATRVVNGESLELGYLGISSSGGHEDAPGVPVTEVVADSPAAEAGLQPGDVILSMDGEEMKNISELSAAVKLRSPDEVIEFVVRRDGDLYTATVVLGTWE